MKNFKLFLLFIAILLTGCNYELNNRIFMAQCSYACKDFGGFSHVDIFTVRCFNGKKFSKQEVSLIEIPSGELENFYSKVEE